MTEIIIEFLNKQLKKEKMKKVKKLHKLYDFMEARERLNTVITKTKLIHSSVFSKETGNDVYIKPENLQIKRSL